MIVSPCVSASLVTSSNFAFVSTLLACFRLSASTNASDRAKSSQASQLAKSSTTKNQRRDGRQRRQRCFFTGRSGRHVDRRRGRPGKADSVSSLSTPFAVNIALYTSIPGIYISLISNGLSPKRYCSVKRGQLFISADYRSPTKSLLIVGYKPPTEGGCYYSR